MVPPYEKLLELAVNQQIVEYIESNNLLSVYQAGFREKNSCETALQTVLYTWKKALDDKQIIGVVFLDFKRAFETIDRRLLLLKLKKYGFDCEVLKWFSEYLSDREQVTKFNNCTSSKSRTTHGVPQGTVLGPTLFVLYLNDIVNRISKCKIQLFADDTLIYVVGRNSNEIINTLNSELNILFDWLNINSLAINTDKTKMMLIKSKYNATDITPTTIVRINNVQIEQVTKLKYLGVVIDQNLCFSEHHLYICNKVAKKVNLLRRINQDLSSWTKKSIYQSIIAPHFNFCSTILFLLSDSEISILQKKQNQAMRIILKCSRYTRIKDMLESTNFLSVRQTIMLNTMVFIFKMLHELLPRHLIENCVHVRDIHNHNTRIKDNFYIQSVATNFGQNNLFHNGLKQYNRLPANIKGCENINRFKIECKKYIKHNVSP